MPVFGFDSHGLWLFLSRHTAGYHLHKVNAKLGIASRAQLGSSTSRVTASLRATGLPPTTYSQVGNFPGVAG